MLMAVNTLNRVTLPSLAAYLKPAASTAAGSEAT